MNNMETSKTHPTIFQRWFGRAQTPPPADVDIQARQGNADAQFHLGLKYACAGEPDQDLARAAEWYRQAAEQNHPLAQFNLAAMYAGGQGVPRDEGAAEIWFGRAAVLGDPGAQHHLGMN